MTKVKKTIKSDYSIYSIKVRQHNISVDASINYEVRTKLHLHPDLQVYRFNTQLELEGHVTTEDEKQGDAYSFSIYGHEPLQKSFDSKLKDCQERTEDGSLKFIKKRGTQTPVYDVPKGIGHIEKVRGDNHWIGALWVSSESILHMMTLLSLKQDLYMSIHEEKEGRVRFIIGFTLLTSDPDKE